MNYHSFSEARFAEEFAKFLKQKGYPEESLIYQPTLFAEGKQRYRPDFAIVDPERQERLAIIEVKGSLDDRLRRSATTQLQSYARALENEAIDVFLAVPVSEINATSQFGFYKLSEDGELIEFSIDEFPHFRSLIANKVATKKEILDRETEETTDSFKTICFSIAAIVAVLFVADVVLQSFGITLLSTERLSVLGIAIALMTLPFVTKLRGLGFEYERNYPNAERKRKRS